MLRFNSLYSILHAAVAAIAFTGLAVTANSQTAPIPVGLDAYTHWEDWPNLRIGQVTYMRSTYDRSGGNEGADASHFLYQESGSRSVTLDLEGPGVLNFARYNHWHGSPWHYIVDDGDHIVTESTTPDPLHPVSGSTFLPATLFPEPLSWTWASTRGADLMGVPIPFEHSFKMEYERTHYGTGYYIYSRCVPGIPLSHRIKAGDGKTPPDAKAGKIIAKAGEDLVPAPGTVDGERAGIKEMSQSGSLSSENPRLLLNITTGPSVIRGIQITAPIEDAVNLGRARLRIRYDGDKDDSVDAPIALFFGAGTLYNRDRREWLVKAFPVNVRYDYAANMVTLACWFPMPFRRSAQIEIIPQSDGSPIHARLSVRYQPRKSTAAVGYFHATYKDFRYPERGRDLTLLDTKQEGRGEWTGHLVGTSIIFSHNAVLSTLEGDPRFFFDDSLTPQVQGTGTEEWCGGGDYWGGQNMTLPFFGHPTGAPGPREAKNEEDKIESAYRFLLADLMPFGNRARICLEHGGTDESVEHYETVTYWYGVPESCLILSDTLKIGDASSETAHRYSSPMASDPYTITSRYEWGVDHLGPDEIYPAEVDTGRTTVGDSEFELALDPNNCGALFRRKLDYSIANQRAEVFVADLPHDGGVDGRTALKWKRAGIWYLAGSNMCVYSNPRDELGAEQHIVQTSNRRFRDDDFLVPVSFTGGRNRIRIKIHFTPLAINLYPDGPPMPNAWSEISYSMYSYLQPNQPHSGDKGSPHL